MAASAAPAAPTGLNTASLTATSFTLRWSAATSGTGGIAGYDVYRNGVFLGSSTSRSFVVSGLAPTTAYSMAVSARDGAGGVSPVSVALEVTTPADTTNPTRPADLAVANLTTTSLTLSWTGSTDNVGVTGYNIYRSGVLLGTASGTTFDVTGLTPDKNNNFTVRAMDAAGNLSAASVALAVRTLAEPPSIPTDLFTSNLRPASFTLRWPASTGGTGGIAGYEVYLNGDLIGSPATRSLAISGLTPAVTYMMTVLSRDTVGNSSALSAPLAVTTPADTAKPKVPAGLSAADVTTASFTLTWTASTDNVAVVGYDVFRNNVLIGSTSGTVFNVSGLAPATLYSMRVKARDAAGNISGYSAILAVTTSSLPNAAPTVSLNAPSAGSTFTLPFTLTLSAAATDSDGTIIKVEFFDNGALLGETTTPSVPGTFTFPLTLTSSGPHALTARATDNQNSTADSAPVVIMVYNSNASPTVTLTAPTTGTAPAFLTLTAEATDSDGTITKVEFYDGSVLLGEVLEPSAANLFTFPLTLYSIGTYTITAVATDNSGTPTTSTPVVVTVESGPALLPFVANFEPTEGYRVGPLLGQLSWFATGGVTVGPGSTPSNQQELAIPAAQPTEIFSHSFSATGVSPVFVDFLARPVAGADPGDAVMFSTPAAQVALVGTASPADLWIFGGGGLGWYASGQTVPTDANGRTIDWLRLTTREDYLTKKWDLYLNNQMVAADVPFADANATALTDFSVNGHAAVASAFDDFYAGPENPLFADVNRNGLDDVWETSHRLSLATANRQLSPTGNGVTVLQAYLTGTDPNDFYNGVAPLLSIVSGDNQTAAPGQFNGQPMVISVTNASGTPLANAPVRFTVAAGGGLLSNTTTGTTPAATLYLRTAADGMAQAYYQQPATAGISSQILVTAGAAQVTFQSSSASATDTPLFNLDFETQEGFVVGPLDGQNGWQLRWGAADVLVDALAPSGTSVVSIDAYSAVSYNFPNPLSGLSNVDFYARPVASSGAYASTQYVVGDAGVALVLTAAGTEAEIYTLNYNDYAGAYNFVATGFTVPVDGFARTAWLHFRFKLNFNLPQWALYLDNALVASNLPMQSGNAGALAVVNDTSAPGYLDHVTGTAPSPSPDSDGNGLLDAWEILNFGYVGVDPEDDPDGDGLTNLQEYQGDTDPNDYFNGVTPQLTVVSGDNQNAALGQFNPQPLVIVVTDAVGTPLSNATVTFTVASGYGLLATDLAAPEFSTTISLRTNADGIAQVYYQQPAIFNNVGVIQVSAGGVLVDFSSPGDVDSDRNSMSDAWELQYFGQLGVDPEGDPDGDGYVNIVEARNGSDPLDFFNGEKPQIVFGLGPDGRLPLSGFLTAKVLHQDGQSWPKAPVKFHVNSGATRFKLAPEDADFLETIEVRAGADGVAAVYLESIVQ